MLESLTFRRKCSVNPYKSLRLPLGEMSFSKDWLGTDRGDPYPRLASAGSLSEATGDGYYTATNDRDAPAMAAHLLGQHFPFVTYAVTLRSLEQAAAGILFSLVDGRALRVAFVRDGDGIRVVWEMTVDGLPQGELRDDAVHTWVPGMQLILTCRGAAVDVYLRTDKKPVIVHTIDWNAAWDITSYAVFSQATAALWVSVHPGGRFVTDEVSFYLDGGVSHADLRVIRYEDGTPLTENGKIFLTASSRLEAGGFQSVLSWRVGTSEFALEGALFFDCGDGNWCADVASSILYDRRTAQWLIWATSFSHGHILCHATSSSDIRYGITVLDAELMPIEQAIAGRADALGAHAGAAGGITNAAISDDTLWYAKSGDEDPDFLYDAMRGKWMMAICRLAADAGEYRYFLFESDEPFAGYRFVDRTREGAGTGGSIIPIGGGRYEFVCGANFTERARYDIYAIPDLSTPSHPRFDYDDGGYRGWGTVFAYPCGNRARYYWITFDRHGGSTYNWSYGNIYIFEAM